MKCKILGLLWCIASSSLTFADTNHHVYPIADDAATPVSANKALKWPGYCEIEVINDSFTTVRVYGYFDDGMMMRPFNIYTFEYPHYISLFYYGYCHAGMDLYVDTRSGYPLYSGYTLNNTTIHIVPYMAKEKPKVEVMSKSK